MHKIAPAARNTAALSFFFESGPSVCIECDYDHSLGTCHVLGMFSVGTVAHLKVTCLVHASWQGGHRDHTHHIRRECGTWSANDKMLGQNMEGQKVLETPGT